MRKDNFIAAILEAGLLGLAALLGYLLHSPLVFTSLGPTAYEVIETPNRPSAKPYNIIVGHAVGIVAGLVANGISNAWSVPAVSVHGVPPLRIVSILIAALLTVLGTLALKATQPAALSTTLLITLGDMQSWHAVLSLMGGIVLIAVVGEPIRRRRSHSA